MKKRPDTLTAEEKRRTLDMLYTATASLRGREAMRLFLRDLLTESERIMLGRRIWIARLLLSGETYDEIASLLRVGNSTIRRVDRWLNEQIPGYEKAIQGIEDVVDKRALAAERRENPFSYAALKKKYPLHFLLFPAPRPKQKFREKAI